MSVPYNKVLREVRMEALQKVVSMSCLALPCLNRLHVLPTDNSGRNLENNTVSKITLKYVMKLIMMSTILYMS